MSRLTSRHPAFFRNTVQKQLCAGEERQAEKAVFHYAIKQGL